MPSLTRTLPVVAVILLAGCSFFDKPSAEDALETLNRRVGNQNWRNVKVSNCKGDASRTKCVVSYDRGGGQFQYYEELTMEFVKTPSGWTSDSFKVLKTEDR